MGILSCSISISISSRRFLNELQSLRTIVQRNQIPSPNIEPIQILNSILSIIDILVYNESSALLITGLALADLADGTEAAEHIVELVGCDLVGQVADVDYFVYFGG